MKMKEKISIEEFDNKKFKIRFVEEDDNRKAILTHYLHNYRNGVKKHYEKDAIEYLNQIVKYKNHEEKLNLVDYEKKFTICIIHYRSSICSNAFF